MEAASNYDVLRNCGLMFLVLAIGIFMFMGDNKIARAVGATLVTAVVLLALMSV